MYWVIHVCKPVLSQTFHRNSTTDPIHLDPEDSQDLNWADSWVAPTEIRKWFPYYHAGYDLEGAPLYVLEFGNWKYVEALADSKEDDGEKMKKSFEKYLEQNLYLLLKAGMANDSQGIAGIMDWDGFSLSNYASVEAIQLALRPMAMLSRLYSVLNYAILINGKCFLWPVLDPTTANGLCKV